MSHQPNNIAAGTQIVALVEIRGPNGSLVHPRGAVGVVTRTPAVVGENFLVRFPDGFEKALEQSQFEVLKHFKDRLGEVGRVTPCAPGASGKPPAFDLETFIIYRCVVGSRAYGLENDESDTDRRGVYLAPAEMQWSLFGAPEQFEDNGAQSCYWELQKFIIMALRANPNILECLYSPIVEKVTPLGEELVALRQRFLSQMIFQTFNGYAMSQFKKMEQDLRNRRRGALETRHASVALAADRRGDACAKAASPCGWRHIATACWRSNAVNCPWAEVDAWRKELHQDFECASDGNETAGTAGLRGGESISRQSAKGNGKEPEATFLKYDYRVNLEKLPRV